MRWGGGKCPGRARYSPALPVQAVDQAVTQVRCAGSRLYSQGVAQRGQRQGLSPRPSHIPGQPVAAKALPTCWLNEPNVTSPSCSAQPFPGAGGQRARSACALLFPNTGHRRSRHMGASGAPGSHLSPPQEPESASLAALEQRKPDKDQLENSGTKTFQNKARIVRPHGSWGCFLR